MSVEDLQADIDRNTTDLDARPISTVEDVKAYIKDTLLPLFKSAANVVEEIDDDLSDLVNHADTIIQPEDAALFALVIKHSIETMEALKKRLKPGNTNDDKWGKILNRNMQVIQQASARLMEVTVSDEEPDGDDDEIDPALNDAPQIPPPSPTTIVSANTNEAG